MEQRQNVAATYARSLQLHAAATVDVLMDQAVQQGDHVSNLSEGGSIDGLLASGLIDNQVFAALDAGGEGALNTGRQRNMMQSGYCDGVLYTWVAGAVDAAGNVQRPRIKGLGEAGLGSIAQVLSQHVGPNSYGSYSNGSLTTPNNVNVAINCPEMAAVIPEEAPVLFQEMASEFELSRNGSFYEFENRACPNANEEGFDRYRRLVTVEYDSHGVEINRQEEAWDLFLQSCHDTTAAERISVDLTTSTADQIDFSAQSLDGGATKSVVCFEAKTTQKDEQGEAKAVQQGESFSNCESATEFETSLAEDVEIECSDDVIRTETDTRACTGDGWSGSVTYEREIVMCTKYEADGPTIDYEKRGEWERAEVDCSKEETTTASCPFGAGLVSYKRTNRITNPETLTPMNPDWNYVSDSCATDEDACIGVYAGNGVAFAQTANGATNPPVPETTSMSNYCGDVTCEASRTIDCDDGYKTQRREYSCLGGGWTTWSDDDLSECDPDDDFVCYFESNGDIFPQDNEYLVSFREQVTDYNGDPVLEDQDCYISFIWDGEEVYSTDDCTYPLPDETETDGYKARSQKENGNHDSYKNAYVWSNYEICREKICTENVIETDSVACGGGYYGNKTRTRTCNGDGTEYSEWSEWNTASCQPLVCTANSTETQTQSCSSGYTGNETRSRTCNATGTGYGAWSAWDDSGCEVEEMPNDGYSCEVYNIDIAQYGTIDDHSEYGYRLNVGVDASNMSSYGGIQHEDTYGNSYQGHRVNGIYRDLDQDGDLEFYINGDAVGVVEKIILERYVDDSLAASYSLDVSSADSQAYLSTYGETSIQWETVPTGFKEAFSYYGPAGDYKLKLCQSSACVPEPTECTPRNALIQLLYGPQNSCAAQESNADPSQVCFYDRPDDYVTKRETYDKVMGEYKPFCDYSYYKDGVEVYATSSSCSDSYPSQSDTGGYTVGTAKETWQTDRDKVNLDYYTYSQICMDQICTPNEVEYEYEGEDGAIGGCGDTDKWIGYTSRYRICNSDGTAWGAWSTEDRSHCEIKPCPSGPYNGIYDASPVPHHYCEGQGGGGPAGPACPTYDPETGTWQSCD